HTVRESIWPNTHHYESVTAAMEKFKDDDLETQPGTKYEYSSPGYTLLGCAIEGASGKPYATFVDENIFAPAGMTGTTPDDPRKPSPTGTAYFSKGLIHKLTGML